MKLIQTTFVNFVVCAYLIFFPNQIGVLLLKLKKDLILLLENCLLLDFAYFEAMANSYRKAIFSFDFLTEINGKYLRILSLITILIKADEVLICFWPGPK